MSQIIINTKKQLATARRNAPEFVKLMRKLGMRFQSCGGGDFFESPNGRVQVSQWINDLSDVETWKDRGRYMVTVYDREMCDTESITS